MSSTTVTLATPSPTGSVRLPPPDGDVSKGPVILAVTIVSTSLALIAVGLRMFVRTVITRGIGWDDYAILGAAVSKPSYLRCLIFNPPIWFITIHNHSTWTNIHPVPSHRRPRL